MAYQELRKKRAEYVKNESLSQFVDPEKRGLYYRTPEMQRVVMGYDAVGVARQYMQERKI